MFIRVFCLSPQAACAPMNETRVAALWRRADMRRAGGNHGPLSRGLTVSGGCCWPHNQQWRPRVPDHLLSDAPPHQFR